MFEVLDMVVQYMETCKAASPNASSIPVVLDSSNSEESQDYGGSGIFDDFELPDNVATVPIDEVKQAAEVTFPLFPQTMR